jgi:hypothetical protein
MSNQKIVFEYTGGDTGARGNDTEGIDAIQPYVDGELAREDVFRRPPENLRRRTEILRKNAEDGIYREDQNGKWVISAGLAGGAAVGESVPTIYDWDEVAGTFLTTGDVVIQALNTPAADVQETVLYTFTGGSGIGTGTLTFDLLSTKRNYNSANLIHINWEEKTAAELAGGIVPGVCDGAVTGNPDPDDPTAKNILTIQIVDTGAATLADVALVLTALASDLTTMGFAPYVIAGDGTATIAITDFGGSNPDALYQLSKTYERELHRIPSSVFTSWFASNSLSDGDTLAIQYADFQTRMSSTNAAGTSTVSVGELFKITDHVESIGFAIPVCKRIGDDLYWVDGTIVPSSLGNNAITFGENGNTVQRLIDGTSNIYYSAWTDTQDVTPTGDGSHAAYLGVSTTTLQAQMQTPGAKINTKAGLSANEIITGDWEFRGTIFESDYTGSPLSMDAIVLTKASDTLQLFGEKVIGAINKKPSLDTEETFTEKWASNVVLSTPATAVNLGSLNLLTTHQSGTVTSSTRGINNEVVMNSATTLTAGADVFGIRNILDINAPEIDAHPGTILSGLTNSVSAQFNGSSNFLRATGQSAYLTVYGNSSTSDIDADLYGILLESSFGTGSGSTNNLLGDAVGLYVDYSLDIGGSVSGRAAAIQVDVDNTDAYGINVEHEGSSTFTAFRTNNSQSTSLTVFETHSATDYYQSELVFRKTAGDGLDDATNTGPDDNLGAIRFQGYTSGYVSRADITTKQTATNSCFMQIRTSAATGGGEDPRIELLGDEEAVYIQGGGADTAYLKVNGNEAFRSDVSVTMYAEDPSVSSISARVTASSAASGRVILRGSVTYEAVELDVTNDGSINVAGISIIEVTSSSADLTELTNGFSGQVVTVVNNTGAAFNIGGGADTPDAIRGAVRGLSDLASQRFVCVQLTGKTSRRWFRVDGS